MGESWEGVLELDPTRSDRFFLVVGLDQVGDLEKKPEYTLLARPLGDTFDPGIAAWKAREINATGDSRFLEGRETIFVIYPPRRSLTRVLLEGEGFELSVYAQVEDDVWEPRPVVPSGGDWLALLGQRLGTSETVVELPDSESMYLIRTLRTDENGPKSDRPSYRVARLDVQSIRASWAILFDRSNAAELRPEGEELPERWDVDGEGETVYRLPRRLTVDPIVFTLSEEDGSADRYDIAICGLLGDVLEIGGTGVRWFPGRSFAQRRERGIRPPSYREREAIAEPIDDLFLVVFPDPFGGRPEPGPFRLWVELAGSSPRPE